MKEKWSLKGVDWGRLLIDAYGLPAMRYSPAPQSCVLPSTHVVANQALKCVAHGDGRLFPFLFPGPVVGLCGPNLEGPGASSLLLREGGRIRPVVGPDHPRADHSDVVTARLVLSPFAVTTEFSLSDLFCSRRVALPIAGLPAIVVLHRVYNGSRGVRWLTAFDAWTLAPHVINPRKPRSSSLSGRFSKVFGRAPEGNSYLKDKTIGNVKRVAAAFDLDPDIAARALADFSEWSLPPLQFVPMTRGVRFHLADEADVFEAARLIHPFNEQPVVSRQVLAETRFEIPPGKALHASFVVWFGEFDEAKEQLRQLLPVNSFEQNEAVLWHKRVRPGLIMRDQKNPALEAFEGMWYGGACLGALQYNKRGGAFAPPLGHDTFVQGTVHDSRYYGAVMEVLSWTDPGAALAALENGTERMERSLRGALGDSTLQAEDAIWNLLALGTYYGLHGGSLSEPLMSTLPLAGEELVAFLQRADLYGSSDLLTTAWCDPDADRAHAGRIPERSEGRVESLTATAVLVRACEVFGSVLGQWLPGLSQDLAEVAQRHRQALEALVDEGKLEPWLLEGKRLADPAATVDHLVALLWMGLNDEGEAQVFRLVNEARQHRREPSGYWGPKLLGIDCRLNPVSRVHYLKQVRLLQRGRQPCPDWHALLDPVGRQQHLDASRGTTVWPGRRDAVYTLQQYLAFLGLEVSNRGLVCRVPESLDSVRLELPVLHLRASERNYAGEWRGQGDALSMAFWPPHSDLPLFVEMKKGEPWNVARE